MNWQKLPAIKPHGAGCLCCQTPGEVFPLDRKIGVGAGVAEIRLDGVPVWRDTAASDLLSGHDAERLAARDPDRDWQIVLEAPLYGRTYQRHGVGLWVLVGQSEGFA